MSDYTVLADTGESIINMLWKSIQTDPVVNTLIDVPSKISLDSPADVQNANAVRLSLYLYRIVEDATTKNQYQVPGLGLAMRKAPLTLDLHYLVTPLFGAPRAQQIVLGKVMQVLYDHAILSGSDLTGGLAGSPTEIRIALSPVSLEETTLVWQALQRSYRLSVCYGVRVALIDSTVERFTAPVVRKNSQFGEPALNG